MSMRNFAIKVVVGLAVMVISGSVAFAADWYDYYQDAKAAMKKEDWNAARMSLEKAIAEEPEPSRRKLHGSRTFEYYPYLFLGITCLKVGDLEAAYQYCEYARDKGVEPTKDVEQCLSIASQFLAKQGQTRQAQSLPTPTPIPPAATKAGELAIKVTSEIPAQTDRDALEIEGVVTGANGIKEIKISRENLGVIQTQTFSFPNNNQEEMFRVSRVLDAGQNDFTIEAVDAAGHVVSAVFSVVRGAGGNPQPQPITLTKPVPTPKPLIRPTPKPELPTPEPETPDVPPDTDPSDTGPSITVTSDIPEETEQATLTIEGNAADIRGITEVSVNLKGRRGLNLGGAPALEKPKTPRKQVTFKKNVPLEVGTNEILIVARNTAGQEQQETVSIVRTAPPPVEKPAVAAAVPGGGNGRQGEMYAVIIGIAKYQDPRLDLQYTGKDAQGLYDVLTNPKYGGVPKDHVKLLLDENATNQNIKSAIGTWLSREAGENDTVVIYYSGHGAPEGKETYWVTYSADVNDLYSTALSNNDVTDMLSRVESKRVITFLDSCYSAGTVNRTRAVPSEIPLDKFADGEGRVVISASNGKEQSLELDAYGHGVFTYYLLEGLKGNADQNQDGVVDLDEIWDYVKSQVSETARKAGNRQTPVMQGSHSAGIPLTFNLDVLQTKQQQQNLAQKTQRLKDLVKQKQISVKLYNCAYKMLKAGASEPILDGLLSGEMEPDVFNETFQCE